MVLLKPVPHRFVGMNDVVVTPTDFLVGHIAILFHFGYDFLNTAKRKADISGDFFGGAGRVPGKI